MLHLRRRAVVLALPFMAVMAILFGQLTDPGGLVSRARNLVFDAFQRADPRPYVDPAATTGIGVRYIDIDEESLRRYGQWPWPRTRMAEMVRKAAEGGARAIVFDIVFAEADRTSPEKVPENWPAGGAFDQARALLAGLPGHDGLFAASFAVMPVVTGVILTADADGILPAVKSGISAVGSANKNEVLARLLPAFPGAVRNLDVLDGAALGTGALNIVPEPDGIVRRVNLVFRVGDLLVPGLSLDALRLIGQPRAIAMKLVGGGGETGFGAETGIVQIRAGGRIVDTSADGSIWIHFTGPAPERRIPAHALFEGTVAPERLKDTVLFVGTSAVGLRDLKPTPLSPALPGVEVHVQALEQMLLGYTLQRPDYAVGVEMLYALVLGLAVGLLALSTSAYWAAPVVVAGILAAWSGSWWAFTAERWLLDPLWPSIAVLGAFVTGALVNFARTESERRFVRGAFAHYLAPEVVDRLAANPDALKLGGETRDLTIMFCDIRGFTKIAEAYRDEPEALTRLINRILTPLTRVVLESKGTIDKYMGDCIMAFWNAPLDDPEHPANACRCALRILEALETLNAELEREHRGAAHTFNPIEVGIGLHSGLCVVGNMGSDLRFDYSVLGDAVNVAARLQTYSGNYGTAIVVSEETAERAGKGFAFLKVDRIALKGRDEPVTVYALTGTAVAAASPAQRAIEAQHQKIFAAFSARDWTAVRALTAEARTLRGASARLYDLYDQRVGELEADPPGPDWDGAWRAVEK